MISSSAAAAAGMAGVLRSAAATSRVVSGGCTLKSSLRPKVSSLVGRGGFSNPVSRSLFSFAKQPRQAVRQPQSSASAAAALRSRAAVAPASLRRSFHSSARRRAEAEPEAPKFEPDTKSSRKIYLATIGGVAVFVVYSAVHVYQGYFTNEAKREARRAVENIPLYKGNPVVFMDITVDGEEAGRLVIQLRKDVVPKAAENFRALCTGEKGFGYAGSRIHSVLPGQYIVAGDFQFGTGKGGASIYGQPFQDESYALRHIGPGILSMASHIKDENESQFFINLGKAPIHDGRYVVFGNLMKGFDIVESLSKYGTWRGEVSSDIRIARCGELRLPASARVALVDADEQSKAAVEA